MASDERSGALGALELLSTAITTVECSQIILHSIADMKAMFDNESIWTLISIGI